jgi:hypothetical protein
MKTQQTSTLLIIIISAALFFGNPQAVTAKGLLFWKKKKADTTSIKESKFDELTKGAAADSGMFNVYKKEKDFYFEVPTKLMNRDMLIVNKISQVPADLNEAGINKGMNYENLVVQFSLNKEQEKVFVLSTKPFVEVKEGDKIGRSVADNYAPSILEYFKVEAYTKDSSAVLIKVNKVYDGNQKSFNNVFGMTGLGTSALTDYSYIGSARSFPENIVVKSFQTTTIPSAETNARLTVEVTSNLVLLPEKPMVPRFEDSRVGYFATRRWYFNDDQHQLDKRMLATRWRLEPKDKEAYARGELVEPVKPIIFYIDPATPVKWRKYIIQGVYDWQVAFEQAGFKNAIIAKEVADGDKDFDIDDVRYSAITYAASDMANAMGPSVYDPRSGEIIEADVVWWHNVMTAVQSWMRVQTGIIDSKSRANRFADDHMGEAIRFISSHEVGHTLGLKHNMGSSSFYPVDSLRSPDFCQRNATASSIMDYARFNYVAQPEDSVVYITPKIGLYDKFAIEWAYRYYGKSNPFDDQAESDKLLRKASGNPYLTYLPTQDMRTAIDPRAQTEDLGDNSVKASEYGLKNLKRIMPNILKWTTKDGDSYLQAGMLVNAVIGQWYMYSYHVLANVGGIYLNNTVMGDGKKTYTFVEKEKQKEAVAYLLRNVVAMPEWLFKNPVYDYVYPIKLAPDNYNEHAPAASFKSAQSYVIWDLLENNRITRMVENEAKNGAKAYAATEMFADINSVIFSKTYKGQTLDFNERATQKAYIDALIIACDRNATSKEKKKLYDDGQMDHLFDSSARFCSHPDCHDDHSLESVRNFNGPDRVLDAVSIKRGELLKIEKLLKAKVSTGDVNTQYHYEDMLLRINDSLRK